VQSAIELLASSPNEPVSVAAVCHRLGVRERTLQRAFQETIGVSPRAYERDRRLYGVHGAILREGNRRSITDIAMSFGFWHLGRFAGAYGALFGCSPSETRRRIWGGMVIN
jgi:transcriptional regulator GlxA family with amidase domain